MSPKTLYFAGLLTTVLLLVAAGQHFARRAAAGPDGAIQELRLAHVTIHPGVIAMYDEAARRYSESHPNVRITQAPVPLKLWTSWQRTNLIGNIPPSIMAMDRGLTDEELARHFEPLDPWLDEPNPYNRDTALEHVPWRDTFRDGLTAAPAFRASLQRVYGIPQTVSTIRVFANRDLLVEITGSAEPPRTFAEFVALGEAVKQHAARTGRALFMIAASETHCRHLMHRYFIAQTQRLAHDFDHLHRLGSDAQDAALAYLRGDWDWSSPGARSGLQIMRQLGEFTSPGFLQMEREEGIFYFNQQRALLLATGSWEADSVLRDCNFPVVIFPVPLPEIDDPVYGAHILGPASEAGLSPGDALGIPRHAPHPEIALDFLRFLTSAPVAEMAMRTGRRLTSLADLPTPDTLAPFHPREEGYPLGFSPDFMSFGGSHTNRFFKTRFHELFRPGGTVDAFAGRLLAEFDQHLRRDLVVVRARNIEQQRLADSIVITAWADAPHTVDSRETSLWEAQTLQEFERLRLDRALKTAANHE